MKSNLEQFEEEWAEEAGYAWYRSKEPVPIYHSFVGGGYLSNKKWPLNEGSTIFIYNITYLQFGTLIFRNAMESKDTAAHTYSKQQFGKLSKKI